MLSRSDIAELKKTRASVQKLEAKLIEHNSRDFPMGRLAEACRAVDDAILQLFILAKVHDMGVTAEDLKLTPQKDAA